MPIATNIVSMAMSVVECRSKTAGAQAISNTRNTVAAAQNKLTPSVANRARGVASNPCIWVTNVFSAGPWPVPAMNLCWMVKAINADEIYKPIIKYRAKLIEYSASIAPTRVPPNIASMVEPSIQPLAFTSVCSSTSSGRMPYFAGL